MDTNKPKQYKSRQYPPRAGSAEDTQTRIKIDGTYKPWLMRQRSAPQHTSERAYRALWDALQGAIAETYRAGGSKPKPAQWSHTPPGVPLKDPVREIEPRIKVRLVPGGYPRHYEAILRRSRIMTHNMVIGLGDSPRMAWREAGLWLLEHRAEYPQAVAVLGWWPEWYVSIIVDKLETV